MVTEVVGSYFGGDFDVFLQHGQVLVELPVLVLKLRYFMCDFCLLCRLCVPRCRLRLMS